MDVCGQRGGIDLAILDPVEGVAGSLGVSEWYGGEMEICEHGDGLCFLFYC